MARSPAGTVAQGPLLRGALRCGVLTLAACALPAWADPELARQKRCMNCHALERKVVGPALRDVAQRYAAQVDAVPLLAQKIVKGGANAWGPVPMAANPHVSSEEAARLAAWVLSLK